MISALLMIGSALFPSHAQQELPIGVGDVITMDVHLEKDLYIRARVDASGIVRFPLIGDIPVVGKTVKELSDDLVDAYLDGYLVNPSIVVQIEEIRPFYVRGAVKYPGSFPFQLGMTMEKAIAVAGGQTDRASNRNWVVIRGADKQRIKATADTPILPGDIVEIPESLF
ncbi:polysaccharide biosynthesis/export family protein [Alteromonas sp. ASW11-36]|uniref:Polysaccharide biosynthesis/export family protein n=1 Tax=Alteromonas arenosi TaxID=3055817 RepID=A0ABT7SYZ2_9ALTE|nr:polysaccharide biosynthesis/export family protein [Alteromonas sp. ASW11-36]MDM7861414.1 polysaccharide biosynthesis/export family protein [Alteromonas sp. ASW11-36]